LFVYIILQKQRAAIVATTTEPADAGAWAFSSRQIVVDCRFLVLKSHQNVRNRAPPMDKLKCITPSMPRYLLLIEEMAEKGLPTGEKSHVS